MSPTIIMLKDKETNEIYTGIGFDGLKSSTIFVIERVYQGKRQCMIEHSQEEMRRVYDIVMYKNDFDLIAYLKGAF